MPDLPLRGIVPALVTPFREDERIDYAAWQAIIDAQLATGVDGLFACGSQGEFYALDYQERQVALRFCRQAMGSRGILYGNVGCVTTAETVRLARQAEEIGVDVLVAVTPYYVKLSQDELVEHYVEVCRAAHVPVLAYNFPQHGGAELMPETLGRIAAMCPNLAGVKDSGGNLERTLAYLHCADRPLAVFEATESLVLEALGQGCVGVVTACANVAPRLFVDLYRAFREGRRADAECLQALAAELGAANGLGFPRVMKEAMAMIGLNAGACRRPVGRIPPEARGVLAKVLEKLRDAGYCQSPGEREKSLPAPARP